MKIAFLVSGFPTVSETFITNQAIGLLERGHQVDIYSFYKAREGIPIHDEIKQFSLLDRAFSFAHIPQNYFLRVALGGRLIGTYLPKHPLPVLRSLNFFRHGRKALSLRDLYKITLLLRNQPYDIIHCQFGTLAFEGIRLLDMLDHKPNLVVSFRGYDVTQYVQKTHKDIYRDVFKRADIVLVNCDFFKQHLLKLGCDELKIAIHHSGLDLRKFIYKVRHFDPNSPIRIATTGNLVEKKGIEYAIRAVAKLIREGQPIVYDIIGDGPLKPDFERLIQEAGVGHAVSLLGHKTQTQVIEILEKSHLFVAPSVTAADGNQDAPTNVLKEAMALGLPVVSTFHGGIPELVEDGISGLLAPERDAEALSEKILYLIKHPDLWPQMSQAARNQVEKNYDLQKWNDRLVEVYKQLL